MNKKRYYKDECFGICDNKKGDSDYTNMMHSDEVVDLLNSLTDENKQLKLKIQEECNFTLGKEWNCEGKMVELLHNGEIIGYLFKSNLNELADPTKICNHLNKICTENQQNGRNIRY